MPSLDDLYDDLIMQARVVLAKKNADYSGEDDPLRNLRGCAMLGVPPDLGVLVRVLDKVGRLASLTHKAPQVSDETIRDTVIDVINYMVLYYALRAERR